MHGKSKIHRALLALRHSSIQFSVHRGLTYPNGQSAWALVPSLFGVLLASCKKCTGVSCASSCHVGRSGPDPDDGKASTSHSC